MVEPSLTNGTWKRIAEVATGTKAIPEDVIVGPKVLGVSVPEAAEEAKPPNADSVMVEDTSAVGDALKAVMLSSALIDAVLGTELLCDTDSLAGGRPSEVTPPDMLTTDATEVMVALWVPL